MPLAVAVDGANRHDRTLVEPTLQAMVMERPRFGRRCPERSEGLNALPPTAVQPHYLCLDKGYDYDEVRASADAPGNAAHIRTRGEATASKDRIPGYRARRWVVERTHSWLNRLRRLVIRWEKKVEHYLAMLHCACAWITFRAAGVFG